MARRVVPLTDKKIKNEKPTDKERTISDGDGLQLRILPNGTKSWRFVYTSPTYSKRSNITLGTYPSLTLLNARKKAIEYRELVAIGNDPKEFIKEIREQRQALTKYTLYKVAQDWFEVKADRVSEDYAKDVWRSLELHIFPNLGNVPISKITQNNVIDTLRVVEAKGSLETVKRLHQRLNEILDHAHSCGLIPVNCLARIGGVFKKPKKSNMPAIDPDQLPQLMKDIANASIKKETRCLLEFQLHTMTRPSEATSAMWKEIDLDNRVWTIPAERMKKRKVHKIPLTDEVLNLLNIMKKMSTSKTYVFPSQKNPNKPMNSQTANMALKRMGYGGLLVAHGLRAIASTYLNGCGQNNIHIEAALAHNLEKFSQIEYNRASYLEPRRSLMKFWSDHIVDVSNSNVSLSQT
ncbi:tyrosine-type recombinase/integrase [Vibrio antiquarius]|uniref:tyrosine-type recombinase/integrase n=1 Tax=Vibrio antiquarius (strain Ex25) TaxID=150340 RepID=UPI0026586D04|nr:tyrosine-type recombinase/integrase [Vibrio antiquarius]MCR9366024.1 tyrosine-type recombinase/integrase [Vibrio antiquarius]